MQQDCIRDGFLNYQKQVTFVANIIIDETIEYVGILAKLELSDDEKEQAKKDMAGMLDYFDKLNELDTTGITPMSHIFPIHNVFREDVVTNGDDMENIIKNAPESKNGTFVVPITVEQRKAEHEEYIRLYRSRTR